MVRSGKTEGEEKAQEGSDVAGQAPAQAEENKSLEADLVRGSAGQTEGRGTEPAEGDFSRRYTLVLDLDETLIHYKEDDEDNGRVNFRPYLDEFLTEMRQHFNVVVFTASLQEYADPILNHLDPSGAIFSRRFYRHHTSEISEGTVKDLGILNMDLSKVIIVDNLPENFGRHKDNGIFIKPWFDDAEDCALKDLSVFLRRIVTENVEDVRIFLAGYRSELIKNIQRGSVTPLSWVLN